MFFNNNLLSKEMYESEILRHTKQIQKNKRQYKLRRANAFKASNSIKVWKNIKSMLLFLFFFLLGDVIIIQMQLNINEAYINTIVKEFISGAELRPAINTLENFNLDPLS